MSLPEAVRPRQWRQKLIHLLRRRLENKIPSCDVLVFAGPAAGKTLGAIIGFQRMKQENRLKKFLIFCHRSSIIL